MTITQIHERLRLELIRRIQRGTLSVSLLARQTGFGQSHLSNFLHSRRQLSLDAMDRILNAQHLAAADLMPANPHAEPHRIDADSSNVPVVSHASALGEPYIRPAAVQTMLHLPASVLLSARARASSSRRAWQRFVAVRIPAGEALHMDPLVLPDACAILDRHYNTLAPYRVHRPTLYAVRHGARILLRYLEFQQNQLILRPLNLVFPVDLIEVGSAAAASEHIVGRVLLLLNEP